MGRVLIKLEDNGNIGDTVKIKRNTSYTLDFPISETYPLNQDRWKLKVEARLFLNPKDEPILLPIKHYFTKPRVRKTIDWFQWERVTVKLEPEIVNQILNNSKKSKLEIFGRDQGVQRIIFFERDI